MPRSTSDIQTSLNLWYAARDRIASGQTVTIDGQTVGRASLSEVNRTIQALERELAAATNAASGRSAGERVWGPTKLGGMGY
jgi:hypothetical protein